MEKKTKKTRLLAIETSGKTFSVAAAEPGTSPILKGEIFLDVGLKHSEILKEACRYLTELCGWKKGEITHLAVSTGPGSFTGLRVGIAFARAVAQAAKIPLIGIPTFDILARQGRALWPNSPICVLIESIGREVFSGIFPRSGKPRWNTCSIDEISELSRKSPQTRFLGDGALKYSQMLPQASAGAGSVNFPRASTLAELAAEKILSSKKKASWEDVAPFYMRPPLVVERLKKKGS